MRGLSATGITREFSSGPETVTALDGVDLRIAPGELVALMGPSGSGKSTLLQILGGLDEPDSGSVLIDGESLSDMDDDARTVFRRERLGFVFQAFHLVPTLSVLENVALPFIVADLPRSRWVDRASEILEELGIGELGSRPPHRLSGGQQQRVAVARALVNRPAVVLADEPTGNLDEESAEVVKRMIRAAVHPTAETCGVLVTHDPAVAAMADRVVMLAHGRVVSSTAMGRWFENQGGDERVESLRARLASAAS